MTGHDGYDSISVAAGSGSAGGAQGGDRRRRSGATSPCARARRRPSSRRRTSRDALGFIRTALLVFAGVALLVGGFLIFNTFTVTVAQRTQEFALLRVLGASRAQVLRSVLVETFVVGVVASILGVLVGIVLAPALAAMLKAFGIDLGTTGLVISPRTIIIGLRHRRGGDDGLRLRARPPRDAGGAGDGDARRRAAGRRPPAPAPRSSARSSSMGARPGRAASSGCFGGLDATSAAASLLGLRRRADDVRRRVPGAAARAAAGRVLGAPMARQGLPGKLARENAIRQPQRTAVTAAALMVGLALVVLVTVFAAGIRAIGRQDDRRPGLGRADRRRTRTASRRSRRRPPTRSPRSTASRTVSAVRFSTGYVRGRPATQAVTGIDPATIDSVLTLEVGPRRRGHAQQPDRLAGRWSIANWAKSHNKRRGSGQSRSRRRPARRPTTRSRARSRTRPA